MAVDNFADWLAWQLRRRDWTAADFARRLKTNNSTVSMWMTGDRVPSPASVERIAEALLLDFDEVAVRAGIRPALGIDLDATTPEAELAPYIRRVQWNEDRIDSMKAMMENWIARDEGRRR